MIGIARNTGKSQGDSTTNTSAIQTPVNVTVAHGDAFVSSISKRIRFASSAKRKAG